MNQDNPIPESDYSKEMDDLLNRLDDVRYREEIVSAFVGFFDASHLADAAPSSVGEIAYGHVLRIAIDKGAAVPVAEEIARIVANRVTAEAAAKRWIR